MQLLLRNCRLVSPGLDIPKADILLQENKIATVNKKSIPGHVEKELDCQGLIAVPGFIDIHCHGRSNADFSDATYEAFTTIGHGKLEDGVTGFLATTLTMPQETLLEAARLAKRYTEEFHDGAQLLGLHLEGPFFNQECAGAQNPAYLKKPNIADVLEINNIFPVKKVSFSPELEGGLQLTKDLCSNKIMPSGAHSAADYACFEENRQAGMKHLTHFCNVMTPVHHLRFGMVGGGLMANDVYVEMICDGVHLCDQMIALIAKLKGPSRMMLITDAIRASAMPDGMYSLGGLPVIVKNGKANLTTGPVAGSTLRYYGGLQKLVKVTGLPLCKAIQTTSYNQALSLHLSRRGKIVPGYIADIALLDQDLVPQATIVGGRLAWSKK